MNREKNIVSLAGLIPDKTPESGCKGTKEWVPGWGFEYDCGYNTTIDCDDCKYGGGKKNPEAKCNQQKF